MAFACQHCRKSLEVSEHVAHQGAPHAASALGESFVVLPQPAAGDTSRRDRAASHAGSMLPDGLGIGGGQVLQAASMHEQLRTVGRLLELSERCNDLSAMVDGDAVARRCTGVPLCYDCAIGVLQELERRLKEVHDERSLMQRAFAELESGGELLLDAASDGEIESEIEAQLLEKAGLRQMIAAARRESEALQQEAARLRRLRAVQGAEHDARHRALNVLELRAHELREETLREAQLAAHCERELRRLLLVSVRSESFHIAHDGSFGTINGLRLGRLADAGIVDWAETNGALGQVALLAHTLSRAHRIEFTHHLLLPMGSTSRIVPKSDARTAYELYGSSSLSLTHVFSGRRFDKGLAMLLACVRELLGHAEANPRVGVPARPPHPIDRDAVDGLPVRYQLNQEERWTRALKCLLVDLKWLLAWDAAVKSG